MTYSIVARDPQSGHLGVAAQSCYFALGRVLPWARAGVGAVATQSLVDPGYGPRCLDLMAAGSTAGAALDGVRAADENREVRQVGVVDHHGNVAAFTGSGCIDHVGQAHGDGFTAQANMMAGPGVCEAMAAAFEASSESLAERMVDALLAAEGMGGDARGQMSATLIVVDGRRHANPWEGVLVDVRVDHHDDPLTELARLVRVATAYRLCDEAEEAMVRGEMEAALAFTESGLAILPDEGNLRMDHIATLLGVGRLDEARAAAVALVAQRPSWEAIIRSLVSSGLIPLPAGVTIDDLFPSDP